MNFSLSRSLSCTAHSENILPYTGREFLLNTGNLIKDVLPAIKTKDKYFNLNIQLAPLVIYL